MKQTTITRFLLPLLTTLPVKVLATEVIFPPISPLLDLHPEDQHIYPYSSSASPSYPSSADQHPLRSQVAGGDVDIRDAPPFSGLTTFANLPYVQCLSWAKAEELGEFDVAILGAGFDTATTGRPGARFGPHGIRWGSRRIEPAAAMSFFDGKNPFTDWATIVDCGDAPLTVLDNNVALRQLRQAHEIVHSRLTTVKNTTSPNPSSPSPPNSSNSTNDSNSDTNKPTKSHPKSHPRILTLGGDHTTTLPALNSTFHHFGPVSVIHFDSHIDTWDPLVLGGGISHYAGVNHGTFLHIAHEAHFTLNSSIHVGVRAPIENRNVQSHDGDCGFSVVTAREIDMIGVRGIIERIKERVKGTKVYITLDIDVLDPAFAPATGTAEPGGWSSREVLSILDGLVGLEVVGADVVEVSPVYDTRGESTQLVAAEIVRSLLQLMVSVPVYSLV